MDFSAINKELEELSEQTSDLRLLFVLRYSTNDDELKRIRGLESYNSLKNRDFVEEYQNWYSKSVLLVGKFFPERFDEFVELYSSQKNRKCVEFSNYSICDALAGYRIGNIKPYSVSGKLFTQFTILKSLKHIVESRYKELIANYEFDVARDELRSAALLKEKGFLRAAGAICGVLLEKHLKKLLVAHGVIINKQDPTINDLNALLYKERIIDLTQNKYITYLGDIRNKCDHDKDVEPTLSEVNDLITGTNKVISTF